MHDSEEATEGVIKWKQEIPDNCHDAYYQAFSL